MRATSASWTLRVRTTTSARGCTPTSAPRGGPWCRLRLPSATGGSSSPLPSSLSRLRPSTGMTRRSSWSMSSWGRVGSSTRWQYAGSGSSTRPQPPSPNCCCSCIALALAVNPREKCRQSWSCGSNATSSAPPDSEPRMYPFRSSSLCKASAAARSSLPRRPSEITFFTAPTVISVPARTLLRASETATGCARRDSENWASRHTTVARVATYGRAMSDSVIPADASCKADWFTDSYLCSTYDLCLAC